MENTARNFALQLGSLISLYISITALIVLLFGVIHITFPDATDSYWRVENFTSQIRFSIATLIVFFPAYVVLTRMVNKIRRTEHGSYVALTKWLIYLSLVVAGGVILGDLVTIILAFLEGEITTRFILKALTVLVIIGLSFYYYLLDAKGYWQTHEKQSIQYGMVVSLIVAISLVVGFMNTETPKEVRERKLDERQITDLSNIQSRVFLFYRTTQTLPETLESAYDTLTVPEAPEERPPYAYEVVSNDQFKLCALFEYPSDNYNKDTSGVFIPELATDWEYAKGRYCFTITVPEQQGGVLR